MAKTYSRLQIERGLKRKGFTRDFNDHRYLRLIVDGARTHIRPYVQHGGGGKDVGAGLVKLMAIECYLSISDFRDLVACRFTKDQYAESYRVAMEAGRPPWHEGFRLLRPKKPSSLPKTSKRLPRATD